MSSKYELQELKLLAPGWATFSQLEKAVKNLRSCFNVKSVGIKVIDAGSEKEAVQLVIDDATCRIMKEK